MGPPENLTWHCEKKKGRARKRPARRPRARQCWLKGCERRFHAEHARQHYCSSECREAAREWWEWKARRKYRATAAGKRKRNGQSQRYRKRVKERKPPEKEAVSKAARVITKKFFRSLLRPAWLLGVLRALATITASTVLLAGLPARDGTRLGAGAALAKESRRGPSSSRREATGAAAVSAAPVQDELAILIPSRNRDYSQLVQCWADENLLELECKEIGEHYGRYRLHLPEAERAMARSLERYGQLSPVVVCRRQERYELIDGFKRLGAARGLARLSHLWARLLEADERTAKAAIYGLNRAGGHTRELEEAWIVQALVREDGLSQVEVAELLGRHKSWVCRRLALIERLGAKAREELRVGLLSPTAARQIVRLPEGNQAEVLEAIRREALSGAELAGVVDLWLSCADRQQQQYLLRHPREALSQANRTLPAAHDPRLSEDGNRVWKRVGLLLDVLGRMEVWLAHQGRTGLTPDDRVILLPRFQKLARDAGSVAALSQDFVGELEQR